MLRELEASGPRPGWLYDLAPLRIQEIVIETGDEECGDDALLELRKLK